jgi:hypothetical protein
MGRNLGRAISFVYWKYCRSCGEKSVEILGYRKLPDDSDYEGQITSRCTSCGSERVQRRVRIKGSGLYEE